MGRYVLGFQEIDQTQVAVVGGSAYRRGDLPAGALVDRTGVRLAGRRGCGACHPADWGWAADPHAWNGRLRRNPAIARPEMMPEARIRLSALC